MLDYGAQFETGLVSRIPREVRHRRAAPRWEALHEQVMLTAAQRELLAGFSAR